MMRLPGVSRLFRRASPLVLAPRDAYALWAERYPARPHNALMRAEQGAMSLLIATTSPARALDVGTGTGRYLPLLAAAGARFVAGVDLSMAMLRQQESGRPLVRGDACCLPFRAASFDLITASLMVGDVADLEGWTAEMARLLTPGGHLVYSDFHPIWMAEGWRRTFDAPGGRRVEVLYHPHALDDHLRLLESAGFDVRALREPRAVRGGRARLTRRDAEVPVVVVFHAVKRDRAGGGRGGAAGRPVSMVGPASRRVG